MTDPYNETITRSGRTYHYDPDYDCYYPRYEPMNHWSKYNWLYVVVVLAAVCYYVEFV